MEIYSDTSKKILRRNFRSIAESVGCTREYVSLVLKGRVTRDTKTTRAIKAKAEEILHVLAVDSVQDFT